MEWLVYVHPVGMAGILALGLIAMREGLRIRRARQARQRYDARRHRRLARFFVGLALLGLASGLASMGLLRGEPVLESVHGRLSSAVGLLLIGAAGLGFRLERGAGQRTRTLHVLLGAGGLLLALVSAATSFAILP